MQGIRLVATFLMRTGEYQRTLGEGVRLLQAAFQPMCLPQGETPERLSDAFFRWSTLLPCLREQPYGISSTPGQGVDLP